MEQGRKCAEGPYLEIGLASSLTRSAAWLMQRWENPWQIGLVDLFSARLALVGLGY
jgi:hypothetical protein